MIPSIKILSQDEVTFWDNSFGLKKKCPAWVPVLNTRYLQLVTPAEKPLETFTLGLSGKKFTWGEILESILFLSLLPLSLLSLSRVPTVMIICQSSCNQTSVGWPSETVHQNKQFPPLNDSLSCLSQLCKITSTMLKLELQHMDCWGEARHWRPLREGNA